MSDPEQSRTKRTIKHVSRNKTKYGGALLGSGCILELLHVAGILGPLVCGMPFVQDKQTCLSAFSAVKEASKAGIELDKAKLDDDATVITDEPAPIPTVTQEL